MNPMQSPNTGPGGSDFGNREHYVFRGNNPRPLCSGFRTVDGVEYEIQVFSADEGFAEEVCVNLLLEDGTTSPYEPTEVEDAEFQMLGQEIYEGWIEACYEL